MGRGKAVEGIWDGIRRIGSDISAAGLSTHASSTAFFFFTSAIPVGIVLAYITSCFGVTEQQVASLVGTVVPDALGELAGGIVHEAFEKAGLAVTASLVMLLWTATKGITALTQGLNSAYGVQEDRNFLQRVLMSLVAVVALILLLAAAVYLIFADEVASAVSAIVPLEAGPDVSSTLVRAVVLSAVGIVVFALCYTFLPAGKRKLRDQVPGAALAAAAWFAFSLGFRLYVDHSSNYNLFYGSLATVVLFLFWMYCIFLILLAGGFVNRYLADRHRK